MLVAMPSCVSFDKYAVISLICANNPCPAANKAMARVRQNIIPVVAGSFADDKTSHVSPTKILTTKVIGKAFLTASDGYQGVINRSLSRPIATSRWREKVS